MDMETAAINWGLTILLEKVQLHTGLTCMYEGYVKMTH